MSRAHSPLRPRWLHAAVFAASLAAPSGCASTPDVMVLDLGYRPTNQPDMGKLAGALPIPATTAIWINPVLDQHPEGSRIGVSQEEDDAAVYFGPNGLPPADFVRAALVQALPAFGVPLHNDPNTATHVLEVRMSRFWAVESNLYQTWITGTVLLADRAGNVLWQGEVTGFGKRWGRTFNAGNYLQGFSDSALDFAQNLAITPAFRQAAAGVAPEAAPAAPAPEAAPAPATPAGYTAPPAG
ncbi:MAG: hypothetical protein JNL82_41505 [Myxococcales bacterium]|nr:hypothetical protein [Myxococcales bacterium]